MQDEDVLDADVLVDLDKHFLVGEAADAGLGEGEVEGVGDGLGERPVAVAGDDLQRKGFKGVASRHRASRSLQRGGARFLERIAAE